MKTMVRTMLVVGLACLAAGCATTKRVSKAQGPIFYPPPPAAPRLQFLTSFSHEGDLGGGPTGFAKFIVGKTPTKKPILKPYGVALYAGKLHVCDTGAGAVDVLDLQKKEFRYFAPTGEGQLRTPVNISIDKDGTRYVADTGRSQVLIFGADDAYRGAVGEKVLRAASSKGHMSGAREQPPEEKPDAAPSKNMRLTDVAITADRLHVADMNGHCVRVYEKAGLKPLFTIPRDPADERAKLFSPANVAVDTQGRVYVSDIGSFRVQQYDAEGKHLRTYGGIGDRPGEFARPKGIALDREGRLYVVDAAAQVVQIFDPEGRLLLYFGEPNASAASLELPAKVIVDYDHVGLFERFAAPEFQLEYLVIVTNQYGNKKVSVYGFGHKKQ